MEQGNDREDAKRNTPRIYVASLADYNAGHLHGRWINADQGVSAIRREVAEMLATSNEDVAEEWAIHDYENFGPLEVGEYEDFESVAEAAAFVGAHGLPAAALLQHLGGIRFLDDARCVMEEGYFGEFRNLADYARHLVEEYYAHFLENLPELIRYHIDYDGVARDMKLSGDVFTVEYKGFVHVFNGLV